MAVTIYPGEIVLTRMPCWPHSLARFLDNWMTAALLELYAAQISPYELSLANISEDGEQS
jgi:hypothetical protein